MSQVNFVYIATRRTHFAAARELFLAMAPRTTDPDPGVEVLRYFHYRHMWETKQQELLRHADIRTTMNIYGSAFEETKRRVNAKVAELVLPATSSLLQ